MDEGKRCVGCGCVAHDMCVIYQGGWILCERCRDDTGLLDQSEVEAREDAAFAAARATVETYQQYGGYSFNHHTHLKYNTPQEWRESLKGKV